MGEGGGGEEKGRPSALSFFRFHLSHFPPETPDTQAKKFPPVFVACVALRFSDHVPA